ncbi:hypothetical protein TNCV_544901 [Trichonephila clavipes]|nr:hypothetical protein TNCV_544901 [Trichonephila clavipes]
MPKSGFKKRKCTGAVFLTSRRPSIVSFAVRVNDTHSSTKQIRAGARRAHSSPHLIQHLHQRHSKNTTNDSLPLRRRYCDPHTEHEQNCITHFLHRHLAELEDWYKKWKISINPEKLKQSSSLGNSTRKPPPIYTSRTTRFHGQDQ